MQINFFGEADSTLTDKYTHKCSAPQYEPKNEKPDISELINTENYRKIMANINKSNVDEETKTFLKQAATRHLVFNYAKIADFYANSTPEVQRLMEESALVIIDIDDAIQNGYVKLSKTVKDIMEADKRET